MKKSDYREQLLPKNIIINEIKNAYSLMPQCYEMDEAIILYPGGLIDPEAYIPLAASLAEHIQVAVFIQKMPLNLAFPGSQRTDDLLKEYGYINTWYIAGHSLGGVMAASYVYENRDKFKGLILMASYPETDKSLNNSIVPVLSIIGSVDGVVDKNEMDKLAKNLPDDSRFVVIEGGNHGQFGSYGFQKGDNQALISEGEQQIKTVSHIKDFIDTISHRTIY